MENWVVKEGGILRQKSIPKPGVAGSIPAGGTIIFTLNLNGLANIELHVLLVVPPSVGKQPTQKSDKHRYCFVGEKVKLNIRDHQWLPRMAVKEMIDMTNKNKLKALISILMGSPFYLTIPLIERFLLLKRITKEYRFSTDITMGVRNYAKR